MPRPISEKERYSVETSHTSSLYQQITKGFWERHRSPSIVLPSVEKETELVPNSTYQIKCDNASNGDVDDCLADEDIALLDDVKSWTDRLADEGIALKGLFTWTDEDLDAQPLIRDALLETLDQCAVISDASSGPYSRKSVSATHAEERFDFGGSTDGRQNKTALPKDRFVVTLKHAESEKGSMVFSPNISTGREQVLGHQDNQFASQVKAKGTRCLLGLGVHYYQMKYRERYQPPNPDCLSPTNIFARHLAHWLRRQKLYCTECTQMESFNTFEKLAAHSWDLHAIVIHSCDECQHKFAGEASWLRYLTYRRGCTVVEPSDNHSLPSQSMVVTHRFEFVGVKLECRGGGISPHTPVGELCDPEIEAVGDKAEWSFGSRLLEKYAVKNAAIAQPVKEGTLVGAVAPSKDQRTHVQHISHPYFCHCGVALIDFETPGIHFDCVAPTAPIEGVTFIIASIEDSNPH